MPEKLKLAIAGLGLVGKRHVDAIHQSGVADLCGIVELTHDGSVDIKGRTVPCYASVDTLIQKEQPDGIILSTPTPLHLEQGEACIEMGVPVLIEKPLAVTAHEGARIVAAAESRSVPVLVGHHRRYNPLIQQARSIIEEGRLGTIRTVHANCWFYKPDDYFEVAPWRKKRGAGPISVNLVHDVDLLRYLCGEVVSVQALATPSVRGFENEDAAAAILGFDNGAIGTITVSDAVVSPWSWELTSREYPIYPPTPESCYMIGGSQASLSVPDLKLWTHSPEPDWWAPISATTLPRETSDPLINQIIHFADVINRTAEPLVSADEGNKTLRVIEAIQQAAEQRSPVYL